jgi:type II secretory pathway component GspD/PulD (secretin)/tetratricopeptide (TPR) repeat protein
MRLRSLLLPTLALSAVSCQSSEPAPELTAEATPPTELVDATSGTQNAFAVEPIEATPTAEPVAAAFEAEAAAVQDPLSQDGERIQRQRQQQEYLSGQYIEAGDALLDQADLNGALEQYSKALEVMPSNATARDRLGRVEMLMGDRFATASEFIQDAAARETVRRAQARVAAEQSALEGDNAMRGLDYDAAIEHYREAQLILSYHPLIATSSLDEQIVTGKLESAMGLRDEARKQEAARVAGAARAEQEEKERDARRYRVDRLKTLYAEAEEAFVADDYSRAEALANQILLEDPRNSTAEAMREAAQGARHSAKDEKTRRDYREQWRRTMDEVDTMDVPQSDSLVFDDLRRWAEVSQRQPLEFQAGGEDATADKLEVDRILESVRFAPRFVGPDGEGSPLVEIAAYLQNLTGVNFLVSTLVREDLDEEETTIKLELPERSVKKVLDIIADTSESLRYRIEDGVVKFVTKEEMVGGQVLRMYEVRDIIHPVPNFPGREINISPSGGLEPPDEDIEEREGLVVTSDALESLIRDNIAVDSWNEDPANAVRITESGTMVVNQTPEVQELILSLLDDLREATGIMVDIEARFLSVEDNFLEDIGVDFRGLGQPGRGTNSFLNDFGDASTQGDLGQEIGQGTDLGAFYDEGGDGDLRARVENLYDVSLGDTDVLTGAGGLSFQYTYLNDMDLEMILRAVSKSVRAEIVTAPRVLVFNTARANIAVMNQVAYVQDFDVEIAQAASIADPIISVVQDGVILDVRPVVSADRRFIMMELRPTVATLQRPIQEVATTLGSQNSVTIQLPELDIQRVRTTVPMPDGGTVMLGGLKVSDKQDTRSGVPLLNKIPVVRFLFERKGTYVSNRKLLILINAHIVIPSELEPTTSQLGL